MKPNTPNPSRHATLKWIAVAATVAIFIIGLALGLTVRSTVKSVPYLFKFKRNAELKARGYYMAEFEFKMLAAQYYLNEGSYARAYFTLRRIRHEMETAQGLVRMPDGASPEERMSFLLDRQDPTTGAFMDPRYPLFTYFAPTENVIEALQKLAAETGRPLELKYSLRYLDQIREPERLRAYLDSLLYMKERWANIAAGPGPYGPGVSELSSFEELERLGLYRFSDEWKDTLRQWFFDTQDPATGFWGYRIGGPANWREKMDVNSTWHIFKYVPDSRGENRWPKYPLRYAGVLARNLLAFLDRPVPDDASMQHDWSLVQSQGARMINRLWSHLSESEKQQARHGMAACLASRYRHFFRPADGGFSLYTAAGDSDLDGTDNALGLLRATGSMPGTWECDRLWGKALADLPPLVRSEIRDWRQATPPAAPEANSLRVYKGVPPPAGSHDYDDTNLVQIIYPGNPTILDVMDLRQRLARFLAASRQTLGNWSSIESLREQPLDLRRAVKPVPVSLNGLDLARIAADHPASRRFFVIGYDVFQVPVIRLEFVLAGTLT